MFNELDHLDIKNFNQLTEIMKCQGVMKVLIKNLPKNNNDKNQIYFHHDPSLLNLVFDLTFGEREPSKSRKKNSDYGSPIVEAVFNNFNWISTRGSLQKVPHCKGILYSQYPEVRLSGFKSENGLMPNSLSISFTKEDSGKTSRYLAIGADQKGNAFGLMVVDTKNLLLEEFKSLPLFADSKICRIISIDSSSPSIQLKSLLESRISGKDVKGCRLTADGETVPFTGTQVHGYTLEHELGIQTNASKEGDYLGIELKCFTTPKLTLFTPEPDGGIYKDSFESFMRNYGYKKDKAFRLTGLHRAGIKSEKSGLTLNIICKSKNLEDSEFYTYKTSKPFKDQLRDLQVVLLDMNNTIAASWSLTRLLNNWGVKHNEVFYVPAKVKVNNNINEFNAGFKKRVYFGTEYLWCRKSNMEKIITSISDGTVFLDPAPKFVPDNLSENKRRSQWRLNNISRDAHSLYDLVELVKM